MSESNLCWAFPVILRSMNKTWQRNLSNYCIVRASQSDSKVKNIFFRQLQFSNLSSDAAFRVTWNLNSISVFLEWIREVSGVDHAVHLFLDPFNDMPLLTSNEANISHEENRKVFFLIKFPLKLIYSTEWACPGKVPVQHLDIVLTDATVFEQEKHLLINKHCQRHDRPKASSTLAHSMHFVKGKSFNKL